MPTYDYVCDACGHAFEHFQSMSSKVLRTCPTCKKRKLRRLIGSGAGVIFKGSGFYQTDYKKSGRGASDGKKAGTEGGSSSSADDKPATPKKPAKKKAASDE